MTTAELLDYWRPILRVLDPVRKLESQEAEALYSERERAPSTDIEWQLRAELGTAQYSRILLCGARGSGKTTELIRLGSRLASEYTVIHIDIGIGLSEGAGTLPIVVLFGAAALRRLGEWTGASAETVAAGAVGKQFWSALSTYADMSRLGLTELIKGVGAVMSLVPGAQGIGQAASVAGSVVQSAAELSRNTRLLRDVGRGPLGARIPVDKLEDAQQVVTAVNEILVELHAVSGLQPLLLADGLDKMVEIEHVLQALGDEEILRELVAPMVLSGPVSLRHDPRFNGMRGSFGAALLYNVPVCTQAGAPEPTGIATMVQVYRRRARQRNLAEDLIGSEALAFAARMSAGIVREFLQILSTSALKAMRRGNKQIGDEDVQEAVKEVRHGLQNQLNDERIVILARVLRKRTLPANPEADRMLFENFIACYPNGDVWFRPHETLVPYIQQMVPSERADAG